MKRAPRVQTCGSLTRISPGDHVMVEGLTFLTRKPGRGDIVIFKGDGLAPMYSGQVYVKRVAGEPGDRLRIAEGKLYVNGKPAALSNAKGEIHYVFLPQSAYLTSSTDNVTVPDGHYFVLGDNSSNSADSRIWGFLPGNSVLGRASFCYWPPKRIGAVK